jgi:putative ATP-binding cassette transporter
MKIKNCIWLKLLMLLILIGSLNSSLRAISSIDQEEMVKLEAKIYELMEKAKIPGLSLVILKDTEEPLVKGFGFADLENQIPVTKDTKFELASCSKSFTALAVLQLEKEGFLNLEDPVSKYFSWFYVTYKGEKYKITLRQLLHHTSGIPWYTLDKLPVDNSTEALRETMRILKGTELVATPGRVFHYATTNYDILGAIIEKVSGKPFEDYLQDHIFGKLGLKHTAVGVQEQDPLMAKGYKMYFFSPKHFESPAYGGNNPAAYIVSNGEDVARWMQIQLGWVHTGFSDLIEKSHTPDLTVPFQKDLSSYSMGWKHYRFTRNEMNHTGANPNFSAYMAFRKMDQVGIAVLANTNSEYLKSIGEFIMAYITTGK